MKKILMMACLGIVMYSLTGLENATGQFDIEEESDYLSWEESGKELISKGKKRLKADPVLEEKKKLAKIQSRINIRKGVVSLIKQPFDSELKELVAKEKASKAKIATLEKQRQEFRKVIGRAGAKEVGQLISINDSVRTKIVTAFSAAATYSIKKDSKYPRMFEHVLCVLDLYLKEWKASVQTFSDLVSGYEEAGNIKLRTKVSQTKDGFSATKSQHLCLAMEQLEMLEYYEYILKMSADVLKANFDKEFNNQKGIFDIIRDAHTQVTQCFGKISELAEKIRNVPALMDSKLAKEFKERLSKSIGNCQIVQEGIYNIFLTAEEGGDWDKLKGLIPITNQKNLLQVEEMDDEQPTRSNDRRLAVYQKNSRVEEMDDEQPTRSNDRRLAVYQKNSRVEEVDDERPTRSNDRRLAVYQRNSRVEEMDDEQPTRSNDRRLAVYQKNSRVEEVDDERPTRSNDRRLAVYQRNSRVEEVNDEQPTRSNDRRLAVYQRNSRVEEVDDERPTRSNDRRLAVYQRDSRVEEVDDERPTRSNDRRLAVYQRDSRVEEVDDEQPARSNDRRLAVYRKNS
ncbi:MAG: hypothetical protein E7015_01740 [Alphaproteobacteria bacterium]|nr:hypothetical protein [Alphaproteobacteria bacterium]